MARQATMLLLVEDERNLQDAVGRYLLRSGFAVLPAFSGAEAVRLAAEHPGIAVVVTDVRLPDMYGRRLPHRIEELRDSDAAPLGVVYMSGNATEAADDGPLAPHERFLSKPFELEDLVASVQEVLAVVRPRGEPA